MNHATALTPRTVYALGAAQCINWGVLYYGFAVLLVPLQHVLDVPSAWVAGAYSLGLLLMALCAPLVGRAFDRGHGAGVMRAGSVVAILGLTLVAVTHHVLLWYLAWALLGVAMSMVLYESAFALLQRAEHDAARRMRAIATVTIVGGLASTIFLPTLGWFVDAQGWRVAVLVGAVAVLCSSWLMERAVFPHLHLVPRPHALVHTDAAPAHAPGLASLTLVFTSSTVATMTVTTLLIPHLHQRGVSIAVAASVLGALGIMQLPGRAWVMRRTQLPSNQALMVAPLLLQALALGVIALSPWLPLTAAAVGLYGVGAGLHTLARPWIVQQRYANHAGLRNGQVARAQGLGRAATPALAAAAAQWIDTTFALLAVLTWLLLLLPLAQRVSRAPVQFDGAPDHDRAALAR